MESFSKRVEKIVGNGENTYLFTKQQILGSFKFKAFAEDK